MAGFMVQGHNVFTLTFDQFNASLINKSILKRHFVCVSGVSEQASDLAVGFVSAHGFGDGYREHSQLRGIQPSEHNSRGEKHRVPVTDTRPDADQCCVLR